MKAQFQKYFMGPVVEVEYERVEVLNECDFIARVGEELYKCNFSLSGIMRGELVSTPIDRNKKENKAMSAKVKAIITYKTKVKEFEGGEKYIDYKVNVSRSDCNLKPHEHSLYNYVAFPSILKHATLTAQSNKKWSHLSDLPECISVDTSKFMAIVTIEIEV